MALAEAELVGNMASRLCVAHVFFDRPEWAATLAADAKVTMVSPLYASLADFDLVAPMLARRKEAASLLDLVETFGDRMLDVLLDLYNAKVIDPAELAEALALFADPRAAARLAKELVKQRARPHALAYFARHADLANEVLGPMAEGRSRAALLARETLESAERLHENAGIDEATELPDALRGPARKMDPSLRVERLTRPRLANGKALPLSALTCLLDLLKRSPVETPDPVLVDVLGALDRRSAAELGAEAVTRWSRILADYDQLQPFEQLVRPIAPIGVEEIVVSPPPVPIKGFAPWEAMRAIGFAGKQAPLVAKFAHDKPIRGTIPSHRTPRKSECVSLVHSDNFQRSNGRSRKASCRIRPCAS